MTTNRLLAVTASVLALTLAGAAAAQTAPGPSTGTTDAESAEQVGVADIVVTALKRTESVQKIPATITAVSADTLKRQGVNEITDITKVAPEVSITTGSFQSVTIRGIRTGAFSPTNESPNAVHIDGVYLARFTALRGLFFDIDRVEVLAGPQGTLYGRNSAGGAVNVITTRPKSEFGGQASIEVGNYGTIISSAALNVPLTDTLAVRVAAYQNYNKGYNNNGTDDSDTKSGRLSVQWKPTSVDTVLFTGDFEKIGGKGPSVGTISQVYKQPSIATNAATGAVSLVPAGTPGSVVVPFRTGGRRDALTDYGNESYDRRNVTSGGAMLQYDHEFGWATLTSQFGYRTNRQRDRGGDDLIPQDPRLITAGATAAPMGGVFGFAPEPTLLNLNDRTDSEEIRLASPPQSFTWLIGAYRFHDHGDNIQNGNYAVSYPNQTGTIGQIVQSNPAIFSSLIGNSINTALAYAVFGQATYTPVGFDKLHLTGGVRYNTEHKHGEGYNLQNGVQSSGFSLSDTFRATTYKANASFDLARNVLIYVDHSTGFKSGGFGYGVQPEYKPEKIKAYEAGLKSRFLNNKVQLNLSAWHYDYKNYVTTVPNFFFDFSGPFARLNAQINSGNAGSAKVDGQSAMGNVVFGRHDSLAFDVTHLHTKFEKFDISAGYQALLALGAIPGASAATFNYNGTPIGGAPTWAGNATYDHSFDVAGGTLDFQGAVHYVGRRLIGNQEAFADTNSYYVAKAYATLDTSLRFQPESGQWSITLYGRNLTKSDALQNRTYLSNAVYLPASDPRVLYAYELKVYGPPRTFGAIFSARF